MITSTTVTRRARRSEQEWRALMAQFARSGVTATVETALRCQPAALGIALGAATNELSVIGVKNVEE